MLKHVGGLFAALGMMGGAGPSPSSLPTATLPTAALCRASIPVCVGLTPARQ